MPYSSGRPSGKIGLELGHRIEIAAQSIASVARADAVGFKAPNLAVAEIAVGHARAIAAKAVDRTAFENRPECDIFVEHLDFRHRQRRGFDVFHIAAQADEILTKSEQQAVLRVPTW